MTFRVGQKVVCVEAKPSLREWACDDDIPIEGAIYTIRRISVDGEDGGLIFDLEEIRRGEIAQAIWKGAAGYGSYRFRPIVERKTSIEIFKRMLTDQKVEA